MYPNRCLSVSGLKANRSWGALGCLAARLGRSRDGVSGSWRLRAGTWGLLGCSCGDLGATLAAQRSPREATRAEKEGKRKQKAEKKKRDKKERQKNESMRTCRTIWFFPIGECVRRAAESLNPKKKGEEKLQGRRGRQRGRAKDSKMAAKCVKKWSEAMQSRVKGSHLGAEDGQRGPKRVPSTSEKK